MLLMALEAGGAFPLMKQSTSQLWPLGLLRGASAESAAFPKPDALDSLRPRHSRTQT